MRGKRAGAGQRLHGASGRRCNARRLKSVPGPAPHPPLNAIHGDRAEPHRVTLATARNFEDVLGDDLRDGIITVGHPKSVQSILERGRHGRDDFGTERPIADELSDWHASSLALQNYSERRQLDVQPDREASDRSGMVNRKGPRQAATLKPEDIHTELADGKE